MEYTIGLFQDFEKIWSIPIGDVTDAHSKIVFLSLFNIQILF